MSFVNKFKPAGNPPPGVKMEYTSFGVAQNQKPYTMPPIPTQKAPTQNVQPRGGWADDDDDEPQIRTNNVPNRGIQVQTKGNTSKPFGQSPLTASSNKSDELTLGPSTRKAANPAKDYELMQINESFLSTHEYENNMINELVQPGGARIKQPDNMINNFCKACESFQVPVVGTLLLSRLYEDIPFVSKARTLYLIEAIIKKVKKYFEYFKYNLSTLQGADYSNESQADQLLKISNDIAQYIENPNKPKPQPVFPTSLTTSSPTVPQTTNLLGGDDLLGSPEAKTSSNATSKPNPFEFVKKPAPETSKAQASPNRQANNSQLLDLDFGSQPTPSQPQQSFAPQAQPFSQPQSQPQPQPQVQAQPKKFNPFDVPSSGPSQNQNKPQTPAQNLNQNATKSSGLPGNFKKFQGSSTQELPTTPTQQQTNVNKPAAPVNLTSSPNKMDDLLGSFSGLDFSSNNVAPQTTTQPPFQTTPTAQPTNSFNTPQQTPSTGINSNFPGTQPPSTQPFSQQSNKGPSSQGPNFPNMSNQGFNSNQGPSSFGQTAPNTGFNTGFNASAGQPNKFNAPQPNFPQHNQPTSPMYPPYGGPGNMGTGMGMGMGHGPTGFGHSNSFPGYGHGPTGFNGPAGNWNTGPSGYGGFNPQGYGYGQPNNPQGGFGQPNNPQGGFGQPQNFGGSNFPQGGYNNMTGGGSFNQPNMQGMNAYQNQAGQHEDFSIGGPLGLYSEEAIAKNEELKKKSEKAKNEALFDSLRF